MRKQRSLTLDDSALASNPGLLRINFVKCMKSYPRAVGLPTLLLLVCILITVLVNWEFGVYTFILLVITAYYWRRVVEHFRYGCINPGVVVSTEPLLIAVYTDLSTGEGYFPVIKIIRQRLSAISGETPRKGMRVGMIALYDAAAVGGRWRDFHPKAADSATGNLEEVRRVLDSIGDDEWMCLKEGLKLIPRPFEPGLYFLEDQGGEGDDGQF